MNPAKAAFHATGRLIQNISNMMREKLDTKAVKQPELLDLISILLFSQFLADHRMVSNLADNPFIKLLTASVSHLIDTHYYCQYDHVILSGIDCYSRLILIPPIMPATAL